MKCSKYFGAKWHGFIKSESILAPKGASRSKTQNIRCDTHILSHSLTYINKHNFTHTFSHTLTYAYIHLHSSTLKYTAYTQIQS
jgi:hypothetical protein